MAWIRSKLTKLILEAKLKGQIPSEMKFVVWEEEGRRYLMMEQEAQALTGKVDTSQGGQSLDTVLPASPTPTTSSDYVSGEEDASLPPACPPASANASPTCRSPLSGSDSQPCTPGSTSSLDNQFQSGSNLCTMEGMDPFLGADFSELKQAWTEESEQLFFTGSQGLDSNVDMTPVCSSLPYINSDPKMSQSSSSLTGQDEQQMDLDQGMELGRQSLGGHNILKNLLVPEASQRNFGDEGSSNQVKIPSASVLPLQQPKPVVSLGGTGHVSGTQLLKGSIDSQTPVMVTSSHLHNGVTKSGGLTSNSGANGQLNISVHSFPSHMLGTDATGSSDLALKIAANIVSEQMAETMLDLSVFGDMEAQPTEPLSDLSTATDQPFSSLHQPGNYRNLNSCSSLSSPGSTPSPSPQQLSPKAPISATTSCSSSMPLNTNPAASATYCRQSSTGGIQSRPVVVNNDHTYTSRYHQPPPSRSRKNGTSHSPSNPSLNSRHNNCGHRTNTSSVLEHMLWSNKPLDPKISSDANLAADAMSHLEIVDPGNSNGDVTKGKKTQLEVLLTTNMDKPDAKRSRHSANVAASHSEPPSCEQTADEDMVGIDHDPLLVVPGEPLDMGLFGDMPLTDIDNLWPSSVTDQETLLLSDELQEILREESRQQEAWLQHFGDFDSIS